MNDNHDPDTRMTPDVIREKRLQEEIRDEWLQEAALNLAAQESVHCQIAAVEAEAIDARIAAGQNRAAAREMAAERNLLREELVEERAIASNNAFGFYLMAAILTALLLVGGIYYYFRATGSAQVEANAPQTKVSVAPSPAAPPVTIPAGGGAGR